MALKQGTLRPLRTGVGIALLVIGIGKIVGINMINSLVGNHPIISGLLIAGGGYLLFRQYYSR